MHKYNAKKIETRYGTFDSKKEYHRYVELMDMQINGEIHGLKRQVKYSLIPAQKMADGRVLRGMDYIADFTYKQGGHTYVEDVKPTDKDGNVSKAYKKTSAWREYMLKKKLMKFLLNIEVKEV